MPDFILRHHGEAESMNNMICSAGHDAGVTTKNTVRLKKQIGMQTILCHVGLGEAAHIVQVQHGNEEQAARAVGSQSGR